MTANEIRANWLNKQLPTFEHTHEAIAEALFEIAAQLAELNKRFEDGAGAFNVAIVEGPGTLFERAVSALEGLERRK
jgi:hypothetical protein